MTPKKNTPGPSSRKTVKHHKASRVGRPCPHCGQIKRQDQDHAPHKPSGLGRRRERRAQAAESVVQPEPTTPSVETAPIDAMTVIKGVVERIPAALESVSAEGTPPSAALSPAVRKAVLDEFRTRAQFAGRLAEIDALLWSQRDHASDVVSTAMETHLRELRLLRLTEPEESDRFVVTEGEGELFELLRPGYVDELTGKVILSGQLRRVARRDDGSGEEPA
ncbi:hypothetical protein [Streptomyces sp. NPDC059072]|uniref:hypothetical protein n=1 Tax=Streptomyces sp. NPDC059072 TaxID=3346715 RepID=UPI0036A8D917